MVLARHPWLAPALPLELAFCRVADGVAVGGADAMRIDRLRAIGNAVCPEQAALAFRVLWGRLMEDGA